MDIKTISATLALLTGGLTLSACDDAKKPATEVDAAKDKDKAGEKANADKPVEAEPAKKEAAKGEMSCGEGGCGAGGCGGKKGHAHDDEGKAVHAKGEEGEEAPPAEGKDDADADADADADEDKT